MTRIEFIMATFDIATKELLDCDRRFTLPEIVDGLKAYAKAAEIAAQAEGVKH